MSGSEQRLSGDKWHDRSQWPAGPWDDEPDKLVWTTKTGLPGMLVRNGAGALCGYVAVLPGHKLHGVRYNQAPADPDFVGPPREYAWEDYGDTPEGMFTVHGGLTYSDSCAGSICHIPEPGEPDDVWWFGFDCAHSGDDYPANYSGPFARRYGNSSEQYKTVAYVQAEAEKLAEQLVRQC